MKDIAILNIIFIAVLLWVVMYVNRKYIYLPKINSQRFSLFALRDELYLMAMRGEIGENDEEYKYLIYQINSFIRITKDFNLVLFLKAIKDIGKSKEVESEHDVIENKITNHSENLCHIYNQLYQIIDKVMNRHILLLIKFAEVCFSIALSVKLLTDFSNKILSWFKNVETGSDEVKRRAYEC